MNAPANPFTPLTATTDEIVAALKWAINQTGYATQAVIGRDRRISRHIAEKIAAEHSAHARALCAVLRSVRASESQGDAER